jgi:uncharacterized membrane protein
MARVPLSGGAYMARSVIASAQRCCNLIQEPMPENQGEPMPSAAYPTPGLRLLATVGPGPIRAIRQATTGAIYCVSGNGVYKIDPTTWAGTHLGDLTHGLRTPVSMVDNGLDMVLVDGSANGWHVTLVGDVFAQITDPGGVFLGADRVDFLDTFFLFNKPNTPQFYSSDSLALTFDPLWFANKESYSDLLRTLIVSKRDILLIGDKTTEVWTNVGKPDFPFESQPGVFIDHGIAAKYSAAEYDNGVFWLTADRQGHGIVVMVAGYQTKRISTYAIENEIAGYARIDDAIGFTYQLGGHAFYVLAFPHADRTWVYDITTGLWHEWVWIDANGEEHRHRSNCCWPVNGTLVVGDWQNGNLYALDHRVFTDNGRPIKRVRSFPHGVNDGKRVFYRQFIADFDTGNAPQTSVEVPAPPTTSGFTALPLGGGAQGAAYAVSADGHVAVGSVAHAGDPTTRYACYWTDKGAPVTIGPANSEAMGVSADGSTIVGYSGLLWRWTAAGGLVTFGTASDAVYAMSADASRVVGATLVGGDEQACYWNAAGTRTLLGYLPGHDVSRAQGVSADGSFIVGFSYLGADLTNTERAWRWTSGGGMVSLGVTGAATGSRAFGVSNDGAKVVGGLLNASGGVSAFEWTSGGMVAIPALTIATGISGDGTTIIGSALVTGYGSSFLGYSVGGTVTVPDPTTNPTDPTGSKGTYPDGVSADGKTIVGFSYGTNPLPWIYDVTAAPAITPAVVSSNLISLVWSDDRGHSWGNPVAQAIGDAGQYKTSLQWQRLSFARDRVFELSWSVPTATALQGAWIDITPAQS